MFYPVLGGLAYVQSHRRHGLLLRRGVPELLFRYYARREYVRGHVAMDHGPCLHVLSHLYVQRRTTTPACLAS